jgi:hypothetical protein
MGKSAKTTPPTDPVAAANAQTQSAMQTANYDAMLNRYQQNTPTGSVSWKNTGTADHPNWTQTTALSAPQQGILNNTQAAQTTTSGLANTLAKNASNQLSTPASANGLPGIQTTVNGGNLDQARKQAQDAVYKQQTSMLDPQYAQQGEQLSAQLASQGIVQGSEAYNNAMNNFQRQKDFAYGQARNSAVTGGNDLANQQFGQGLSNAQLNNSAENQGLNQMFSLRGNTLNELQSLMGGSQVATPSATPGGQISAAPTDVASNFYSSQQQQQANQNAKNAASNANTQAGASVASAALLALLLA